MKNIIIILAIVGLVNSPVISQSKLFQEKSIDLKAGYNIISPTERTWNEFYLQGQYNYMLSYREQEDQPQIGLLLNPSFTLKGLYGDPTINKYYYLLQPGKLNMFPTLYLTAPSETRVKLFIHTGVGLKYYPLIDNANIVKGFSQWQTRVGGGINFEPIFSLEATFLRAGHNFANQDEQYFKQNFDSEAFFNAIQVTSKFNFTNSKKWYAYVNWQGFYKSYNNQSFWTLGVGFIPFKKAREISKNTSTLDIPSTELTLTKVIHLKNNNESFDLSGLAHFNKKYYAVEDKSDSLYEVNFTSDGWTTVNPVKIIPNGKESDFEGISICRDSVYLINEEGDNRVYKFEIPESNTVVNAENAGWANYPENHVFWGNFGLEGIAVDCDKNIFYFTKEKDKPSLYKVKKGKVKNLKVYTDMEDISDIIYYNKNLYLLERSNHKITKFNKRGNPIQSFSFRQTTMNNNQQMYKKGDSRYGFAEALLIIENKIYIGMDPNGKNSLQNWFLTKFKPQGAKSDANPTVILEFDKPKGF